MKKGLLIGCGSVFGLFILLGACVAIFGGEDIAEESKPPSVNKPSAPAPEPKKEEKEEKKEAPKKKAASKAAKTEAKKETPAKKKAAAKKSTKK